MQQPPCRRLILASMAAPLLPLLQGCAAPLTALPDQATSPGAQALLGASAASHGLPALAAVADVNVSYAGAFHAVVDRLQPDLVDAKFRGRSEEWLLLRDRLAA